MCKVMRLVVLQSPESGIAFFPAGVAGIQGIHDISGIVAHALECIMKFLRGHWPWRELHAGLVLLHDFRRIAGTHSLELRGICHFKFSTLACGSRQLPARPCSSLPLGQSFRISQPNDDSPLRRINESDPKISSTDDFVSPLRKRQVAAPTESKPRLV